MKVTSFVFFLLAVLRAGVVIGEDRLRLGIDNWLGHASSDKKYFTPCGGKTEAVSQPPYTIESNVKEKCDSTTAYEPPELRYIALFDDYNRQHAGKSVNVSFPNATAQLAAKAEMLIMRGGPPTGDLSEYSAIVPFAVDAVVPVYNVPGVTGLRFTPEMLADIFSGKITRWNDPEIRASNLDAGLPDLPIQPARRNDNASTTTLFVSFLKSKKPFEFVKSATVVSEEGDVIAFLRKNPGAIGYADMMAAIREGVEYGAVKNPAGRFVTASTATLAAASKSAKSSHMFINAPATDAYPITAYAFVAIPKAGASSAMKDATEWLVDKGRGRAQQMGLTPVPDDVRKRFEKNE